MIPPDHRLARRAQSHAQIRGPSLVVALPHPQGKYRSPVRRAQLLTAPSNWRATPWPRCEGATHMPTSSRLARSSDHPSTPPATPTAGAFSMATNQWQVVDRSRHRASSNSTSRGVGRDEGVGGLFERAQTDLADELPVVRAGGVDLEHGTVEGRGTYSSTLRSFRTGGLTWRPQLRLRLRSRCLMPRPVASRNRPTATRTGA